MRAKQLGTIIRELRITRGLTQKSIADRLHIPRSAVAQFEKGERNLSAEELLRLAELFNMSVEELVDPDKRLHVELESTRSQSTRRKGIRVIIPRARVRKFKEVLLYILTKIGAEPHVGETVIYKLMYFIDFDFYERYEEQLIGARYIKNHYGPTPIEFQRIVNEMIGSGEIVKVSEDYFSYPQTKYLPCRSPDLGQLSGLEIQMINDILCRLGHMNATQISEYSHKDVPWAAADENQEIDYESVFYRSPEYSVRDDES